MRRPLRTMQLVVLTAALAVACTAAGRVPADRVDVQVLVTPRGALEVRETLALRPASGPPTHFRRHVRPVQGDGVTFTSASVDGQPLEREPAGRPAMVVSDGTSLSVELSLEPAAASPRVVELAYVVHGAVAVRGSRGAIRYDAIPLRRDHDVGEATLTFSAAPGTHVYDGTGIAEAGWTVARTASGITARRGALRADDGGTVVAEISVEPASIAEPAWQRQAETAEQLMPAFASGGLFILVIGAGILWIIRFQHPKSGRRRVDTPSSEGERRAVRAGLRIGGLVVAGFGVVLAAVTWLTLSHLGIWVMCLPASIVLLGLVFALVSRRFV